MGRLKYFLPLLLAALLLCCAQNHAPVNGSTGNESTNGKTYLKDILVEELDNGSKVTLLYVFPDAGYNVTVKEYHVKNGTMYVLAEITHRSPAAQVVTNVNETLLVDEEVKMVIVYSVYKFNRTEVSG